MGTAGTALEAIQAGKKVFKQGKEIHGNIMEVHDKIHEFIPLSKDIPKNRAELFQASKTAFKQRHEIHGKVRELHGQILDIHGQVLDVHGQVMGVQGKLHEAAQQQAPQDTAGFKKGAKGYARGCFCGCWVMLKAEAKKYITYVFSLIIFAIITIGLICFLIPVLWHHAHLQLLTLTTTARMPETTRGGNLNSRNESVDYRVFLLHYCVSGLTAQAEKQFNVKNGCHYSTQALYDHILPALGTTFTPALAGKDVPDPSTDIQAMFKHYGYTSCCLYIIDVILAPVVAGFFTATLLIPAFLQTLLVYRTMYILKHHVDLATSSLDITLKSNFLYLFCIHFFWILVLLNIIIFRLIDCCRHKRKMRKILQTQNNILEGQHNHDFNGKIGVSNGGVGDVLYDTDNYEPFELQKLAPIKGSTGIIRKPVGLEHENGDLEKANWRDYHCYENQRGRHVGREKEGFETV